MCAYAQSICFIKVISFQPIFYICYSVILDVIHTSCYSAILDVVYSSCYSVILDVIHSSCYSVIRCDP